MPILLNDIMPEQYNAHLLDYNTGTAGPNVTYFSSEVSMFFVKFDTKAALRTITATYEFMADTEFQVVRSISDLTAMLMKGADLSFPDGFQYHCMLTKVGKSNIVTETIQTVTFTFLGYRHLPKKEIEVSSTKNIMVDGNYETSCILDFKTTGSSPSITISNCSFTDVFTSTLPANTVVSIDGMNKKCIDGYGVNVFGQCSFTNFPRLAAGKNTITISGVSNLVVSYLPIYV